MSISFRSSAVVYYGPHSCSECGEMIVKAGREFGGTVFSQPEGPIYPNTEWRPHLCDPMVVRKQAGSNAQRAVLADWPNANLYKYGADHYLILGEVIDDPRETGEAQGGMPAPLYDEKMNRLKNVLVVSMRMTYYDTPEAAWAGAMERRDRNCPTWHADLTQHNDKTTFTTALLDSLPECPLDSGGTVFVDHVQPAGLMTELGRKIGKPVTVSGATKYNIHGTPDCHD